MKTMMKRTYIKPEMELLDSELNGILCTSGSGTGSTVNGKTVGDGENTPDPSDNARGFGDDFGFDE